MSRLLLRLETIKLTIQAWEGENLDSLLPFHDRIVQLRVECEIPDRSAIGKLERVRDLSLSSGIATVDFTALQALESLSVSCDSPDFGNLRLCRGLRRLRIVDCGLKDLHPLSGLSSLEVLSISEAPLKMLSGIGGLPSLRRLVLGQIRLGGLEGIQEVPGLKELAVAEAPRLRTIAPAADLPALTTLEIDACRKIADLGSIGSATGLKVLELGRSGPLPDLAFVSSLKELLRLGLHNVGKIPSLSFLRDLFALEDLALGENTVVADGQMRVLFSLPALRKVTYANRRHYTHRMEDVMAELIDRWTQGVHSFDNAMSADWAKRLEASGDLTWVSQSVGSVLAYGDEEVPAMVGQYAIAAAEVVARLKGRAGPEHPNAAVVDAWVRRHRGPPPDDLVERTAKVLQRLVAPPSQLLTLWQTRGLGEQWRQAVQELRGRVES